MYRVEILVFQHLQGDAQPREIEQLRTFRHAPDLALSDGVQPAPYRLDVQSSAMQDVWRRLRNSSEFRPLWFVTWEQTRIDYHPPVRIHDEELIAEHLLFPSDPVFIDLRLEDPFEPYRVPYYRLDGTVQLTRTRFLHLDLDLEFRADLLLAQQESGDILLDEPENPAALGEAIGTTVGPALVHVLRESRQVRSGEMLYFDAPFLGVLARITATSGQ